MTDENRRDVDAVGGSGSQPQEPMDDEHEELPMKDTQSLSRAFEKPQMDASFLVNNYTAPALAAAYQDREYTLWLCAELLSDGKLDQLEAVLKPYHGMALCSLGDCLLCGLLV